MLVVGMEFDALCAAYEDSRLEVVLGDESITIAQIDDHGRGTFSQAKNLAIRFSEVTKHLPRSSNLYIVTGSERGTEAADAC